MAVARQQENQQQHDRRAAGSAGETAPCCWVQCLFSDEVGMCRIAFEQCNSSDDFRLCAVRGRAGPALLAWILYIRVDYTSAFKFTVMIL
jgi:hypothetical protein